jgi:hypothetical protein
MYVGPYALQRSFKEMELSMYYRTEVLQRPDGVRDWVRCTNIIYSGVLFSDIFGCVGFVRMSMQFKLKMKLAMIGQPEKKRYVPHPEFYVYFHSV